MSERIVLHPDHHLIETVASQLQAHGRDYSTAVVVFPGKRPAHFLRKELASRAGGSIIPPTIYSVDEFIVALYQRLHPEPVRDLEPIDAVALLHAVHMELSERLGGEYFTSFDAFIPIGLKLFGEMEELRQAALPDRRLKEELSALTYNRLHSLWEYYSKFYKCVQHQGYTTRADRYAEVAEHVAECDLSSYAQIIVAGLFKQTRTEQIIFHEIEQRPGALFIFQEPHEEKDAPKPDIFFYQAPDTHGQVFALSALLKQQLDKSPSIDERSVVVLPDAGALFPVVNQTLTLLPQDQYNIALEYPVARTPIFAFVNCLMDLMCTRQGNSYSVEKYIKFILHPYTKNIRLDQRTDITRILFHAIETSLTKTSSKILMTLEEIEQADEVFTKVAFSLSGEGREVTPVEVKQHLQTVHAHTVRAMEHIINIQEFAHHIIDVLTYIYEESTARLHPLFRSYSEAVLNIFLHLEESVAGAISLSDAAGYFNFLHQYIALQYIPFPGTPLKGLQVLGLLETRNLHFDDVYFLHVNEEVLPGGAGSDMLLPQRLREKLGLETRHDRDELSEYYFHLLTRGAKRVHLFFSESGESGKSRYIEQLLWERQKRDRTHSTAAYIQTVRYRVRLANEVVPAILKSDAVLALLHGFTFSASALDTYLHCPIKFYYRFLLRVQEKEEPSTDLDSQDIGKFVHEVLHQFYLPCVGSIVARDDILFERMDRLIDELFVQTFGAEPTGASYLLKRQIHRQLNAFLDEYQHPLVAAGEIFIEGLEQKMNVRAMGTKFEGRLDRIEQRNGKIFILDYKSGPPPSTPPIHFGKLDVDKRESWSEAVTSLQLPIYLLLYSIQNMTAVENINPAYLYLGKNRLGKDCEVAFTENAQERRIYFDQIVKLIGRLVQEIHDSSIPFSPPADLSVTCPQCPYSALCGTTWVQGWKR